MPPTRPAAPAHATNTPATTSTVASRPRVPTAWRETACDWANPTHAVEPESPSYAVDPSITATVATSPGAAAMPVSPVSGGRSTRTPSARRPSGAIRPYRPDHASNASPRSNQ